MLAASSLLIHIRGGGVALHASEPDDVASHTPAALLTNGGCFICGYLLVSPPLLLLPPLALCFPHIFTSFFAQLFNGLVRDGTPFARVLRHSAAKLASSVLVCPGRVRPASSGKSDQIFARQIFRHIERSCQDPAAMMGCSFALGVHRTVREMADTTRGTLIPNRKKKTTPCSTYSLSLPTPQLVKTHFNITRNSTQS